MEILVHICCGPCGMAFMGGILKEDFKPTMLWHNPNIHPFKEYESRRQGAIDFAEICGLPVRADDFYGLRDFVTAVAGDFDARCAYCYRHRLAHTAKTAAQTGFAGFSTTLLASPYQDFDAICGFGHGLAREHGVEFIVRDFRAGFRAALAQARQAGLYMQKYCGCVFSEEERYR